MTGLTRGGAVSEEWIRTKWRTLYNIVLTSDSPKSIWRVDPVEPIGELGKSCTKLGILECSHSKSTTLSNFVSLTNEPKSTPIDIWAPEGPETGSSPELADLLENDGHLRVNYDQVDYADQLCPHIRITKINTKPVTVAESALFALWLKVSVKTCCFRAELLLFYARWHTPYLPRLFMEPCSPQRG